MSLHKIYGCIIAAVLIILAFVGYKAFQAHDAWKDFQKDLAVSQERIKENQKTEQQATKTEQTANSTIANLNSSNNIADKKLQDQLNALQAQVNSKPDSEQIKGIITAAIPALTVTQTKASDGTAMLSIADTQANRDAISQTDTQFKSCRFTLDDCEAKQKNLQDIIAQKDIVIASQKQAVDAKDNDIKELQSDLKKATAFGKGGNIWARTGRVAFPIGCAALGAWGASKANGDSKTVGIAAGASGAVCAFKW